MLKSFISRSRIGVSDKLQKANSAFQRKCLEFCSNKVKNNCLEIGFGNGDNIIKQAVTNKNINFFGIETYLPGILNTKRRIKQVGASNISLFYGDAVDALRNSISDLLFDKIEVLFPDPWEKNKYKNRRLMSQEFINTLVNHINTGGFLHFASDCEEYASSVFSIMQGVDSIKIHSCQKIKPRLIRPLTKFEKRAIRSGEGVFEFVFEKI